MDRCKIINDHSCCTEVLLHEQGDYPVLSSMPEAALLKVICLSADLLHPDWPSLLHLTAGNWRPRTILQATGDRGLSMLLVF